MAALKKNYLKIDNDYKIIILSKMVRYALKYVLIVFYWKFHVRGTNFNRKSHERWSPCSPWIFIRKFWRTVEQIGGRQSIAGPGWLRAVRVSGFICDQRPHALTV